MVKGQQAIVVGAGIIGVTTAEMLHHRGYRVTVVEAAPEVAGGASHANAGQLCFPFALALGSPAFLKRLPTSLLDPASGVGVGLFDLLFRAGWLIGFMGQCRGRRATENSRRLLALAHQSARALEKLRERHPVDFAFRRTAKLWLAPDAATLKAAEQGLPLRRDAGFSVVALGPEECRQVVPELADARFTHAGGIYAPDSPVGDCRAFAQGLAGRLRLAGVTFRLGMRAEDLLVRHGRVQGVRCGSGAVVGDLVVLATGNHTARLLKGHARPPAIAPLTGCSVTLPLGPGAPEVSLTDPRRAVAFCRLGDRLRITGGARFAAAGPPRPAEIRRIIDVARGWTPEAADFAAAKDAKVRQDWSGARPTTPDSLPFIGPVGPRGLYVNAGHGSLGWTLAAGSAERLGALIP